MCVSAAQLAAMPRLSAFRRALSIFARCYSRVPSARTLHTDAMRRENAAVPPRCYYAPVRPSGGIEILYDSSRAKKIASLMFGSAFRRRNRPATFTINKLFSCVSNADCVGGFYLSSPSVSFRHGRLPFFMYSPRLHRLAGSRSALALSLTS